MRQGGEGFGVEQLLEEARRDLRRLSPRQAAEKARKGTVLVDIRSEVQRSRDGVIPGSSFVPRNALEWRLDPSSPDRDPNLAQRGASIALICHEGYQSTLATVPLRRFGLDATDVEGGFEAWRAAGLPVEPLAGRQETL
jgi:rhodanese-related sulfurtransferase